MKLRLSILLLAAAALAAAPAAGQTIKSLGYNTTNGNVVAATNVTFTNSIGFATNARATTRTNLGLGGSDSVTFSNLSLSGNGSLAIGGMNLTAITSGIDLAFKRAGSTELELKTNGLVLHVGSYLFSGGNTNGASTTRANLGLGETNTPTFSNIALNSFPSGSSTGFVGHNVGQLALYGTNVSTSVPAFYGWDGFNNTAFSAATARTNLELGATNSVTFSNVTASGTLTATGNATLNGVNNTMPNATNAASASSLMTRQLSDDRYSGLNEVLEELSRPPMTLGATIVEAANSGSGFNAWTRQQNQVAQLTTFVATNSPAGYSRAGFYAWALTAGAHANTPLSRGWTCGFILNSQTDATGGLSTSIGFGVPTAYQGGALTNRGLRVTFTGNGTGHTVTAAAHNGTNEVVATNSIASGGMEAGTVVRWTPVNVAGVATTNSTLAVYGRATNGNPVLITQLTLTNSIGASQAVGSLLAFVAHSSTNSPTYVANFEISGFTTKWH